MKDNWEHLKSVALEEIEATLEELPKPLRKEAQKLPITFEWVPNEGLQADGIDSETLGLFAGAEFADEGTTVLPPQILIFIGNLWDFSGNSEKTFREEIRTTFLHELGHFFSLDENDLEQRGLD